MKNQPLIRNGLHILAAFCLLIACAFALTLAGCVSNQPPPKKSDNPVMLPPAMPIASSNAPFTGSTAPLADATKQTDWNRVADTFYEKFHNPTNDDSFAKKVGEKIGDTVVEVETTKLIDQIHKALGTREAPAISECCDQLKKASDSLAALRQDMNVSDADRKRNSEQQLQGLSAVAQEMVSNSAELNAKLNGIGANLTHIFYLGIFIGVITFLKMIIQVNNSGSGSTDRRGDDRISA